MIYKDEDAALDRELVPFNRRNENCLNCKLGYSSHRGWACPWTPEMMTGIWGWSRIAAPHRYLTQSMKDSISAPTSAKITWDPGTQPPAVTPDISDQWQAWIHRNDDDCPCGVARARCDYHRKP